MPGNNENKLDRFFRTKADVQLQPSPQAWEKIESHLVKKNRVVFVYRLAAGIVLAGILTIILIDITRERRKEITVAPATTKKTEAPAIAKVEENAPLESAKAVRREKRKSTVVKEETKVMTPESTPIATEEMIVEAIPEVSLAPQTPKVTTQEKGIVLVYSLPALPKKATEKSFPAEEKKTGIQKVMEVAKDVKNSDNPIGELREAKNELFALEFRRDKGKSKNQ